MSATGYIGVPGVAKTLVARALTSSLIPPSTLLVVEAVKAGASFDDIQRDIVSVAGTVLPVVSITGVDVYTESADYDLVLA